MMALSKMDSDLQKCSICNHDDEEDNLVRLKSKLVSEINNNARLVGNTELVVHVGQFVHDSCRSALRESVEKLNANCNPCKICPILDSLPKQQLRSKGAATLNKLKGDNTYFKEGDWS